MLHYRVVGTKQVLDRYEKMQKSIPPLMYKTMMRACLEVSRTTKKDYLTGPRPRRLAVGETGVLRSSINVRVEKRAKEIIGLVGTNIWYGEMWETTGHKDIFPKKPGGVLAWKDQRTGKMMFRKHVKAQKPRPFLGPALEQSRAKIRQIFDRAGVELVK